MSNDVDLPSPTNLEMVGLTLALALVVRMWSLDPERVLSLYKLTDCPYEYTAKDIQDRLAHARAYLVKCRKATQ